MHEEVSGRQARPDRTIDVYSRVASTSIDAIIEDACSMLARRGCTIAGGLIEDVARQAVGDSGRVRSRQRHKKHKRKGGGSGKVGARRAPDSGRGDITACIAKEPGVLTGRQRSLKLELESAAAAATADLARRSGGGGSGATGAAPHADGDCGADAGSDCDSETGSEAGTPLLQQLFGGFGGENDAYGTGEWAGLACGGSREADGTPCAEGSGVGCVRDGSGEHAAEPRSLRGGAGGTLAEWMSTHGIHALVSSPAEDPDGGSAEEVTPAPLMCADVERGGAQAAGVGGLEEQAGAPDGRADGRGEADPEHEGLRGCTTPGEAALDGSAGVLDLVTRPGGQMAAAAEGGEHGDAAAGPPGQVSLGGGSTGAGGDGAGCGCGLIGQHDHQGRPGGAELESGDAAEGAAGGAAAVSGVEITTAHSSTWDCGSRVCHDAAHSAVELDTAAGAVDVAGCGGSDHDADASVTCEGTVEGVTGNSAGGGASLEVQEGEVVARGGWAQSSDGGAPGGRDFPVEPAIGSPDGEAGEDVVGAGAACMGRITARGSGGGACGAGWLAVPAEGATQAAQDEAVAAEAAVRASAVVVDRRQVAAFVFGKQPDKDDQSERLGLAAYACEQGAAAGGEPAAAAETRGALHMHVRSCCARMGASCVTARYINCVPLLRWNRALALL